MPVGSMSKKATLVPLKSPTRHPCSRTRAIGPTRPMYARANPITARNFARPGTMKVRKTDLILALTSARPLTSSQFS